MERTTVSPAAKSRLGLILLSYIAFISLGLPDGLLGVAWPSIRANFSLPLDALGLLFIAATTGYMTSSFLSGQLMARMGVGGLLAASCALTGLAMLGYTLAPVYAVMVALAVVAGFGAGAIDAGLNTYVAAHFGEGLMQWLHASFGVGVTLGPMIMTAGLALFNTWRLGYRVVGAAQLLLALGFFLTVKMWQNGAATAAKDEPKKLTEYKTPIGETLRSPAAWLSVLLFFLYTGAEVTLGVWSFSLLTEARNVPTETAGLITGSYWAMFTVGRVLAGLYTRRVSGYTLLRASLIAALIGSALVWWNPSPALSVLGVAMVGLAIAPIFPGLVSGTEQRVGARHAANTIGIQISAAGFAAAVIPGLAGVLARRISLEIIPPYLTIIYALLLALYLASMRSKE